jgi:hypothetical protein
VLTRPFRGSRAVAAGFVTAKQLRGPRFRRLFRDTYVRSDVPVDAALLAVAAAAATGGVPAGWSAAELLGASCGPEVFLAEVVVPSRRRGQPGLVVRHDRLPLHETVDVDGLAVTGHRRTAFDLGRRPPLREAVVAVDQLSRVGEFDPRELVPYSYDHLGAPGSRLLLRAVQLADARSGSPMETRIRLALHVAGLPPPVLQHPVGPYALDLAYPDVRLAVEYDGREHRDPDRALRDLRRQALLTADGWEVLRFPARDVLGRPWWVAVCVRRELVRRGVLAA